MKASHPLFVQRQIVVTTLTPPLSYILPTFPSSTSFLPISLSLLSLDSHVHPIITTDQARLKCEANSVPASGVVRPST